MRKRADKATFIEPPPITSNQRRALSTFLPVGEYIVFDLETTGGNPEQNGITEICAYRVKDKKIVGEFYTLVNPNRNIPSFVRKITGITNQMVKNEPLIEDVILNLLEFIGDRILVSHNTLGDIRFLRHFAMHCLNIRMDNFFLCSHLLSERLLKESKEKSLQGLSVFFNFPQDEKAHRAMSDAKQTYRLFLIILDRLKQEGLSTIEDAIRLQGDWDSLSRIGWALTDTRLNSLSDRPGLIRLFDPFGRLVYVSSTLNIKRDMNQMQDLTRQPRSLQRQLVHVATLDERVLEDPIKAALFELMNLSSLPKGIHPLELHQRCFQLLSLQKDKKGHIHLRLGIPERGEYLFLWGPIKDMKVMESWLQDFALALNKKCHQRTLELSVPDMKLILLLMKYQNRSQRLLRILGWWMHGFVKGSISQNLIHQYPIIAKHLEKLPLMPLASETGDLIVEDGVMAGYSCKQGYIIDPSLDSKMIDSDETPLKKPCALYRSVSAYWIHQAQEEGRKKRYKLSFQKSLP